MSHLQLLGPSGGDSDRGGKGDGSGLVRGVPVEGAERHVVVQRGASKPGHQGDRFRRREQLEVHEAPLEIRHSPTF